MDFQSMFKQRKFILISSAIGIISMFLPWVSMSAFGMSQSVSGMHGWGVLAFFCFVITGLIALYGNQKVNIEKSLWMLTMILAVIPLIVVITRYSQMSDSFMGADFIGFGMYLTGLAAIAVLISAWLFKAPSDNLKDGFDTLKKNVENKLGNTGGSAQTPPSDGPGRTDTVTD